MIFVFHERILAKLRQAFILSKDVPSLSTRIRCIFFLSTPHRGSNYASILNNIISAVGLHSRQYLSDIATGSLSIQLLNDDFGKLAHELPIFSFWEREKMSVGPSSILVVEMDSAILGGKVLQIAGSTLSLISA
jgi:hypothetical protein